MITKTCTKCNLPKDLEKDFGASAQGKGGKKSICKDCIALMNRARYDKKKDIILKKNKEWDSKNKEFLKDYKAEYYKNNKQP